VISSCLCVLYRCEALGGLVASDVVDAQFHPLSDHHVVVLSRDGLRAFDVRVDSRGQREPCDSWLFPAGAPAGGAPPTAFAFGAPRGWELLCVFVLCEDGSLHYITPVLPTGALLPSADWQELYDDISSAVAAPATGGEATQVWKTRVWLL
jgi:hypothetical protein